MILSTMRLCAGLPAPVVQALKLLCGRLLLACVSSLQPQIAGLRTLALKLMPLHQSGRSKRSRLQLIMLPVL